MTDGFAFPPSALPWRRRHVPGYSGITPVNRFRYAAARAAIERFITGSIAVDPGLPTLVLLFSAVVKAGILAMVKAAGVTHG